MSSFHHLRRGGDTKEAIGQFGKRGRIRRRPQETSERVTVSEFDQTVLYAFTTTS